MQQLLLIIFILTSAKVFATDFNPDGTYLKVDKNTRGGITHYVFTACENNSSFCRTLENTDGYTVSEVSFSGNVQKYLGSTAILIVDTGLFLSATAAGTVTAGGWVLATSFGAIASTSGGLFFDEVPYIKKMAPSYYWKKGNTKEALELAVLTLSRNSDQESAIIYDLQKDFKGDLDKFDDKVDLVEEILYEINY